jgi:hypothetical protein
MTTIEESPLQEQPRKLGIILAADRLLLNSQIIFSCLDHVPDLLTIVHRLSTSG